MGVGTAPASLSNYTTPPALTREQPGELHVLSIRHGGLRLGEYLKRVERVRLSGTEKGMSVEITLDPDAPVQPPVVEVVVAGGDRPVTLALCAATPLVWNVRSERGAAVEAVYLFGEANAGSTVVGVDGERVRQGGRVRHATAWELEQGGIAFDEMILAIRKHTGMRESSFQGHPAAQRFTVPVPR